MRLIPGVPALGRKAADQPSSSLSGIGGSAAALVTPFRDGQIDDLALAAHCERQIGRGTAALVVCGSTGEAPALSPAEQARAVALAVEAAADRVPVIAGCGAPATEAATVLATGAARSGAAALLCAPPPCSRPTQEGIVSHIRAVAHAADRPVILYDVPGRVGVAVADETVARLFESGLVAAIKDAAGDLSRPVRLRSLCGGDLVQFSGDDATAPAYRAMGGHGCISVSANVTPALCAQMHAAWDRLDLTEFARLRDLLAPLHQAMVLESDPVPVKAALCMASLCHGDLRLPLTRARSATMRLADAGPTVQVALALGLALNALWTMRATRCQVTCQDLNNGGQFAPMSRHGMVPPTGRFPAPRDPGRSDGVLPTTLGVLAREGVLGLLLWGGEAPNPVTCAAVALIGLCGIVLWTRWFGLLRPNCWTKACREGLLLWIGAVCMGNLLRLGFGPAPWWR